MAARGRRPAARAADLGIGTRTIPRWLNAYLGRGLDGLRPREATGAAPKVPGRLADEIRRWVIGGPTAGGRDRANGTYAELAGHPLKTHGIAAGRSAVVRFRKGLGVRAYRPTCRSLRADPAEQAKARVELADLETGRKPVGSSC